MDPFSLAAGVAGLVTLVAKITKLVTNYFHGVRRAIEAANELLDELNALRLTLNHLENLLRNDKKDAFSSTSILVKSTDACSNKLTMLHSKLQDNVKQPLQKLRWPLNASFHHEILQHIRNYTQSIHFALTLDGSVLLSKTFEEVVEVLSNQVGVVEHLKQLQSGANYTHTIAKDTRQIVQNLDAASKREEILDWISLAKPEQKHYEMRLRRLEGTGQWLLHYPSFKRWYDESSNAANNLWCHGIPGSGKSILAYTPLIHVYVVYHNLTVSS